MTLVPALEGYRLWARTYDQSLNPVVALESRMLAAQLPECHGKLVADIACGTGRWARHACERGARVIGIDTSEAMLAHCPAPAAIADAGSLPLADAAFDITICALALGYLAGPMPELIRITRPGGSLFVSDIHPQALDRGWTQSFRNGSEVYEIEHRRYSLSELVNTGGLRLVSLAEPCFGEPEREIFRMAGKERFFEEMSQGPAVFIAHWVRT